ncbi:hypothetical protein [Paracoccus luteus]|uniref:hypothetical protein n=1 Tax=Paracoccus luteus TaxID=2508543 RepID=UPI0010700A7F|nr:hypothetical protein [Paracoccus luteus]
MSQTHKGAAETVGEALTGDAEMQSRAELRIATRILGILVMVVIVLAVIVMLFGLPALNIIGLIGTVIVFGLLIAYAAGF